MVAEIFFIYIRVSRFSVELVFNRCSFIVLVSRKQKCGPLFSLTLSTCPFFYTVLGLQFVDEKSELKNFLCEDSKKGFFRSTYMFM